MELPGIITVRPEQTDLLKKVADMMGTSFMEECWYITWLSALDKLGATEQRKEEIMQRIFWYELVENAPYQGVYCLPDVAAATGVYRYSEFKGVTHTLLEDRAFSQLEQEVLTADERFALDEQAERMAAISEFEWAATVEQGKDHLYFYAWAVDPAARGTGALRRLLKPFFDLADAEGLNCYLECYSDRLQSMYEHIGFELFDELHSPDFEVYERRMVRRPK